MCDGKDDGICVIGCPNCVIDPVIGFAMMYVWPAAAVPVAGLTIPGVVRVYPEVAWDIGVIPFPAPCC